MLAEMRQKTKAGGNMVKVWNNIKKTHLPTKTWRFFLAKKGVKWQWLNNSRPQNWESPFLAEVEDDLFSNLLGLLGAYL